MVLYGTKTFLPPLANNIETFKVKNKSSSIYKKKNSKKQKNRNVYKALSTTKSPKFRIKPKTISSKNIFNVTSYTKNRKIIKATTEFSPYFYAIDNTKFKTSDESVKQYLKFVKNITITYPVMIPSRELSKPRESIKKIQKQKEKSRDINSNRNTKVFTTKTSELTHFIVTTSTPKGKLGNCMFELISKP